MLPTLERRKRGQGLLRVPIARRCRTCGADFAAKRAGSTYCSAECRKAARRIRWDAWNTKRRRAYFASALALHPAPVFCRGCGVMFTPLMWDPTYCTVACQRRKRARDQDRRQRALARLAKIEHAKA